MLETIGLLLITAGWIFQILHVKKTGRELCPKFLKLYALGAILLTVGGFAKGANFTALLNLAILVLAGSVICKTDTCCSIEKPKTVSKVKSIRKKPKRKKR